MQPIKTNHGIQRHKAHARPLFCMDQRDHQHLAELIDRYSPGLVAAKPFTPRPETEHPSPPTDALRLPEAQSAVLTRRLAGWAAGALKPLASAARISTRYGSIPSLSMTGLCTSFADIGHARIPLHERVAFFLRSFATLPSHACFFRPKSHTNSRNPYTATLAIAYDFLDAVTAQKVEYYLFLNSILRCERTNYSIDPADHLAFVPLWVSFVTFDVPSSPKAGADRLFKCKTPGCKKQYRQLSGLQYHNTKGGCGLSLKDYGKPKFRSAKNPYACPFVPCRKSFSCASGLDFHITKYHLKKWHFNQGETFTYIYQCPSCPYASAEGDNLRNHILKIHPNPYHLGLE